MPLTAWPRRTPSSRPNSPRRPYCICTTLVPNGSIFLPLPVSLQYGRQQGLHALAVDPVFRLPSAGFLHSIGSSCSNSTRMVVYHLENTLNNAIAQPFLKSKTCPRLWAPALPSESLLEPMRDLVHSLRWQTLQRLCHQADGWAVGLVIFHPAPRTLSTVVRVRPPCTANRESPRLLP